MRLGRSPLPAPLGVARRRRRVAASVGVVVFAQTLCALFFLYRILNEVFGLGGAPLDWNTHELIELGAAAGLLLGVGVGAVLLSRSISRARRAEGQLAELSGAFHDLVDARFDAWRLTPAERDVAFFVLKGFSTAEIAALRKTSEGTVKSQTAAIYRKVEVSGRAQFQSLFIDDLLLARPEDLPVLLKP